MARFSWVEVTALVVCLGAFVACSSGREEDYSCDDVTPCAAGAVCRDGLCVAMDQAKVSASADVVGAETTVLVIDAAGNSCEASNCGDLPYGTQVTFRAGQAPGFRFTGWTGSEECVGTAVDLVIPALTHNTHCTAHYVRRVKIAGHASSAEGGVTASSDSPFAVCNGGGCEVDAGQPVKLRADDRFGQRFTGWSGPGCGSATSFETMVSSTSVDLLCVANFVERIVVRGTAMNAMATIAVSSEGAVCEPGSCILDKGGNATLTAPVLPKFRFAGWSGTALCVGADPLLRLNALSASQECLATYTARVNVSGSSSGATPPPAVTALSPDLYASCTGSACDTDVGGSVTLLAGSAVGYRLTGWSGPRCETERGAAVTLTNVSADAQCVANYLQGIAVIGAVVGAPGDVVATSTTEAAACAEGGCVIDLGGNVTLTAPSPAGYRFLNWDGDEGCTSDQRAISFPSVTQSKTCYARFAERFLVRGTASPNEGGTVAANSSSAGAACENDGCTLDGGGEVALTATAKPGFRFSGWSGGGACSGTDPTVRVPNVQGNTTCQANFIGRFTVGAVGAPPEGGNVAASSDSGAANCAGAMCEVDRGARVSFTATATTGYRFGGWTGCSNATSATLTLDNITQDTACTANFTPLRYTVGSSVAPTDSGSVQASANGGAAQCTGGQCTVNYGTDVVLTALPAAGWRFGGWSGCAMSDQATITLPSVKADTTCQATFQRTTFTVNAAFTPDNGGKLTVSVTGPGAACTGLRCTVPYGGSAVLNANPGNGWSFGGWSGCSTSMDPTLNLANITADAACTANFTRPRFDVTGNAQPTEGGVVAASSSAQDASCNGNRCTVNSGSAVTLLASANPGFRFTNWNGCRTSSTNAELRRSNVTANATCQANFERLRFTVTGRSGPGGAVTVADTTLATCDGTNCTVQFGGAVTFAAAANPGFDLMGWSGCVADPANPARATVANVMAQGSCVANFTRRSYRVAGEAGPGGSISRATATDGTCEGAVCTVNHGGSATFTATVDTNSGYELVGWTGCTPVANNPLRATIANVTAAATCSASFRLRTHTVSLVVTNGTVSQLSSPNGSCSASACTVAHGGAATFEVAANGENYVFDQWTGGCTQSPTNPLQATASNVTADVTCRASFSIRTFTVAAKATGPGTVSASANGATCANRACTVATGTVVTMTAKPQTSVRFAGWTCDNGVSAVETNLTINTTTNVTCTATFASQVTVSTRIGNRQQGAATISGGSPMCAADATTCTVDAGSTVTLTATPKEGFAFSSWTGCNVRSATSETTTLMATSNATCTAAFKSTAPPDVVITGTVVPTAGGSIRFSAPVGPTGTAAGSCTTSTRCTVPSGGGVTISVAAVNGYYFDNFTGCTPKPAGSGYQLSDVTADTKCQANFAAIEIF